MSMSAVIIPLILILIFILISFFAKLYPYFPIDLNVTSFIQDINFFGFDFLMRAISRAGNYWEGRFILVVIVLLLLVKGLKKEALLVSLSTIGISLISEFIKATVARPRPTPEIVNQIGNFLRDDSFPSGHVLFFIGLYGFLLFLVFTKMRRNWLRKVLLVALLLILILIGVSRIYLGAHWFSDTLGSYLIGVVWLYLMVNLYDRLKTK